jgi:hypothetical protein
VRWRRRQDVGGQKVTQEQVDALVQHFRREAQQEGKDFPEEGTTTFVQLRNPGVPGERYSRDLFAANLGIFD